MGAASGPRATVSIMQPCAAARAVYRGESMSRDAKTPGTLLAVHHGADFGGAELSLQRLLAYARSQGWDTRLLLGNGGPMQEALAAESSATAVTPLAYPGRIFSWRHLSRCHRILDKLADRAQGPILVWSTDFYSLWSVRGWALRHAHRLLSHWQGEYDFSNDSCWRKWRRYGARDAHGLLASAPIAEHLRQLPGFPVEKLHVLNPFIDTARFDPSRLDRAAIRATLGWAPDERMALCLGRIGEGKGQLGLAKKFLADQMLRQNWRLMLAGPADGADGEELALLSAQSAGRLSGLGLRKDVPELLLAADLVLFSGTVSESFGLAAAETLLMGTPMLALGAGALPWLLGASHPGLLPVRQPDQLIERWRKMDAAELARLRGAGQIEARRRFDSSQWRSTMDAILNQKDSA